MTSHWTDIVLPSGMTMPAYHAEATNRVGGTGIVLLQEIFGVNANMRAIADDFAARGFHAVVPDLFWRQEPRVELDPSNEADRERATQLMKGLDQSAAVDDAVAAAEFLRVERNGINKVGAVGYCLGGKLAFLMATREGIDAAVSYYGVAIQASLDRASDLCCPVLLHIAEDDHLCPPAAQAAIKQTLAPLSGVTVLTYPGVGHAFARRGGQGFDAASAERANDATTKFLRAHLDMVE